MPAIPANSSNGCVKIRLNSVKFREKFAIDTKQHKGK